MESNRNQRGDRRYGVAAVPRQQPQRKGQVTIPRMLWTLSQDKFVGKQMQHRLHELLAIERKWNSLNGTLGKRNLSKQLKSKATLGTQPSLKCAKGWESAKERAERLKGSKGPTQLTEQRQEENWDDEEGPNVKWVPVEPSKGDAPNWSVQRLPKRSKRVRQWDAEYTDTHGWQFWEAEADEEDPLTIWDNNTSEVEYQLGLLKKMDASTSTEGRRSVHSLVETQEMECAHQRVEEWLGNDLAQLEREMRQVKVSKAPIPAKRAPIPPKRSKTKRHQLQDIVFGEKTVEMVELSDLKPSVKKTLKVKPVPAVRGIKAVAADARVDMDVETAKSMVGRGWNETKFGEWTVVDDPAVKVVLLDNVPIDEMPREATMSEVRAIARSAQISDFPEMVSEATPKDLQLALKVLRVMFASRVPITMNGTPMTIVWRQSFPSVWLKLSLEMDELDAETLVWCQWVLTSLKGLVSHRY